MIPERSLKLSRKFKIFMIKEKVEQILVSFGIDPNILKQYDKPYRFYHNWNHIEEMLNYCAGKDVEIEQLSPTLFLAIIFHDIIYDPKRSDNEEQSVEFFFEHTKFCINQIPRKEKEKVAKMILATKEHKESIDSETCQLIEADLAVLHRNLTSLLKYEEQIYKEYQHVSWDEYQAARVNILENFSSQLNLPFLHELAQIVRARIPNIGIYAGSFNPWHIGHQNILQKAEKIFDKVIIATGRNLDKTNQFQYPNFISNHHQIESYNGLLTDFIQTLPKNANYTLIRGLRNGADLQYEMNQYRFLQDLYPEIQVIQILCDREFEHISSSAIRNLSQFIKPDSKWIHIPYLPNNEQK